MDRRAIAVVAAVAAASCSRRTDHAAAPARAGDASMPGALGADAPPPTDAPRHIEHVFVIVLENTNWAEFHHHADAPFIGHLIATEAHADSYENVPHLHPSEPNYIWLEAGSSLGIKTDSDPAENHRATRDHLTDLLRDAGITWKGYFQGVSGTECPLRSRGLYAAKHDPFVFFDDVTGERKSDDPYCIAHVRPFEELAHDLADTATTPRYAFIAADLCHDMHDTCPPIGNRIAQGDRWLKSTVEMIQASPAYRDSAVFVTWDENEGGDRPIGLILVSPFAKPSYFNTVKYTHSSTLKTVQEILGVQPLLGDAAARDTNDLSDLFRVFP
jgi:phospholipase C